MSLIKNLFTNVSRENKDPVSTERRLHIGGVEQKEGWEILNAVNGEFVDHLRQADDLTVFSDHSFVEIYASHVLEHIDYNGKLQQALKEWHRVLSPGGKIYISVPDLDILAGLFLNKDLSLDERFHVVRMIFGGHIDQHDYHQVGLNMELLAAFAGTAGFENIERVDEFGLFNDTSSYRFVDVPISLNIIAYKPDTRRL